VFDVFFLERSCGYLDEPANGKKLSSSHQYGQSVTFQCHTGYNLVGSSTLTCQSNGLWTADEPKCQSKHFFPLSIDDNYKRFKTDGGSGENTEKMYS